MAEMHPNFAFTGSLGKLSAYRMKGSDKIILRTKGGPSKEKIRNSRSFDITRRINSEFGGRSTAGKYIRQLISAQRALADHNISAPLNALIKPIQAMDTDSEYGKRHVLFTKNPGLLAGFNLNRRNPFDSIIRNPFPYSLSKDELSARIDIPALLPGINFFAPPGKYAVYGLVASMGILPDIFYTTHGYKPPATYQNAAPATQRTAWYPLLKGSPATGLELNLPAAAPDIAFSLILSIGICFGVMSGTDEPDQVKYAGAAKILAMA